MSAAPYHPNPAAGLAVTIRSLASEAHRIVHGSMPDEGEVEALLARIDRVRQSLAPGTQAAIRRWLESLRREVEAAALPIGLS